MISLTYPYGYIEGEKMATLAVRYQQYQQSLTTKEQEALAVRIQIKDVEVAAELASGRLSLDQMVTVLKSFLEEQIHYRN